MLKSAYNSPLQFFFQTEDSSSLTNSDKFRALNLRQNESRNCVFSCVLHIIKETVSRFSSFFLITWHSVNISLDTDAATRFCRACSVANVCCSASMFCWISSKPSWREWNRWLTLKRLKKAWNEMGTGAQMYPAIACGMVTRDAKVSYWPIFPSP